MEKRPTPRLVTVEQMHEGLVIRFADGRSAFYSYDLLYASIETAQVISPEMNSALAHIAYSPQSPFKSTLMRK